MLLVLLLLLASNLSFAVVRKMFKQAPNLKGNIASHQTIVTLGAHIYAVLS
jgi:hypothetical protein